LGNDAPTILVQGHSSAGWNPSVVSQDPANIMNFLFILSGRQPSLA